MRLPVLAETIAWCKVALRVPGFGMNAWRVVEVLGVIADDSRYRVLTMLVQAGENGLTQGRLATRCGISEARLKRHLTKLVQARLIRRNHRRRGIVWKAEARQLADLVGTMSLRLSPPVLPDEPQAAVIDVPAGFRSLASKLATVETAAKLNSRHSPQAAEATAQSRQDTVRLAGHRAKTHQRRLPARLSEALSSRSR